MRRKTKERVTRKRVRFREERISKNLTQRQLAMDLDVTENHIRHIENGYVDPSARFMFKIASYFKMNAYELFPDLVDGESAI